MAGLLEEGDPACDERLFRRCLGQLGTGVSVITTEHQGRKAGVTANSVTSVSLDPPLVLWSIKKSSRSRATFEAATGFAINVLAWDQTDISHHFSSSADDKFSAIATNAGRLGLPLINGAVAHLECSVETRLEGGDHIIFIGRVAHASRFTGDPLMFVQGRYVIAAEHPHTNPAPEIDPAASGRKITPSDARFVQLIFDAHNALSAKFETHRAAEGMTLAIARTLTTLKPNVDMTLDELTRRTYLGRRKAEDTLQELEAQHLVTRSGPAGWSLTETGAQRREAIYQRWLNFQDEQLEGIRTEDLAGAIRALHTLVDR